MYECPVSIYGQVAGATSSGKKNRPTRTRVRHF